MILSEQYGFIFIKTMKTAGTSIEVELSRRVEDAAIVTPILPPEPGHQARNFVQPEGEYFNHMPASTVRNWIGAKRYRSLFKFCVEREPVAKCISQFHMIRNSEIHASKAGAPRTWEEYCQLGKFPVDLNRYAERRLGSLKLLVDRVLPYERLDIELPALMDSLGITGFRLEARAKAAYSQTKLVDAGDVTEAQRAKIYAAFRKGSLLHGLYPAAP